MSDWSCPKCNLRSGQTCADRDCPGLAKAMGQAFRTQPLPDADTLRAENARRREENDRLRNHHKKNMDRKLPRYACRGGEAMSEQDLAVQTLVAGIVDSMKVDLADGYRLAAKVALAALEPTDGVFYARDQGEHLNLKRAHHRVKQKLQEAAEAWNIDMEEGKP